MSNPTLLLNAPKNNLSRAGNFSINTDIRENVKDLKSQKVIFGNHTMWRQIKESNCK